MDLKHICLHRRTIRLHPPVDTFRHISSPHNQVLAFLKEHTITTQQIINNDRIDMNLSPIQYLYKYLDGWFLFSYHLGHKLAYLRGFVSHFYQCSNEEPFLVHSRNIFLVDWPNQQYNLCFSLRLDTCLLLLKTIFYIQMGLVRETIIGRSKEYLDYWEYSFYLKNNAEKACLTLCARMFITITLDIEFHI